MKIVHIVPPFFTINQDNYIAAIAKQTIDLAKKENELGHESFVITNSNTNYSSSQIIKSKVPSSCSKFSKKDLDEHYDFAFNFANYINADIVHDQLSVIRNDLFYTQNYVNVPVISSIRVPTTKEQLNILSRNKKKSKSKVLFGGISKSQINLWNGLLDFYEYHGLDESIFVDSHNSEKEFLFSMSRISEDKGNEDAIKVAKALDLKLILAGPKDDDYFNNKIKPFLNEKIKYVGPLNSIEKIKFYQKALAYINPIKIEEAFGLTMVEAPLCGTPVVGYARGSAPEIISNGNNGFLVPKDNLEELIFKTKDALSLNRDIVRSHTISKGFTLEQNTRNYLERYKTLI